MEKARFYPPVVTKAKDPVSRWLHVGFATAILCQLLTSWIMHSPTHRDALPYQMDAYKLHQYIGLAATAFVVLFWSWILFFRHDRLKQLFPWKKSQWPAIYEDLNRLVHLKLPLRPEGGGLAGLVHGLGLMLVSVVGFLGVCLFIFIQRHQLNLSFPSFVKETHKTFAYWIWWYVAGHGIMAIWHKLKGV